LATGLGRSDEEGEHGMDAARTLSLSTIQGHWLRILQGSRRGRRRGSIPTIKERSRWTNQWGAWRRGGQGFSRLLTRRESERGKGNDGGAGEENEEKLD
jgi:hypothetical protein